MRCPARVQLSASPGRRSPLSSSGAPRASGGPWSTRRVARDARREARGAKLFLVSLLPGFMILFRECVEGAVESTGGRGPDVREAHRCKSWELDGRSRRLGATVRSRLEVGMERGGLLLVVGFLAVAGGA